MSVFDKFLDDVVGKKCHACSECNYTKEIEGMPGEYVSPCKRGHKAGPDVTTCVDCSEPKYHPKK